MPAEHGRSQGGASPPPGGRSARRVLAQLWSTTRFRAADLSAYAERLMIDETRRGVMVMSVVFLGLLTASALASSRLGLGQPYVYTALALAALSVHVCFAARAVRDLRTLYVLGMTLLVISGSAFVLLAHRAGAFEIALFGSVTLLFMVIPMVPWGLREASVVALLIYGLFSSSVWSVSGRFEAQSLWALQMFMLTGSVISLTLVARGTSVRRADIRARYQLEQARREMERLSHQDPLTGAWNRRFLEAEFPAWQERAAKQERACHFALLDLDSFKQLNDSCGHAYGDRVLKWVSAAFRDRIGEAGFLIRTGGDEFTLLLDGDDPEGTVADAVAELRAAARVEKPAEAPEPSLSVGIVTLPARRNVTLELAYRVADQALYRAKAARGERAGESHVVRWELPPAAHSVPLPRPEGS